MDENPTVQTPATPDVQTKETGRNTIPSWIVIVLLLLSYPIGLIVMWFFANWSRWVKLLITLGPFLLIGLLYYVIQASLFRANQAAKQREGIRESIDVTPVQDPERPGWYVYTNQKLGYSTSYPNDWEFSEAPYNESGPFQAVTFIPKGFSGTQVGTGSRIDVIASFKDMSYDLNLSTESFKESNPGAVVSTRDFTTKEGYLGKEIIYSHGSKAIDIVVPKGDKQELFTITLVPDSGAKPGQLDQEMVVFDKLQRSLKIL